MPLIFFHFYFQPFDSLHFLPPLESLLLLLYLIMMMCVSVISTFKMAPSSLVTAKQNM